MWCARKLGTSGAKARRRGVVPGVFAAFLLVALIGLAGDARLDRSTAGPAVAERWSPEVDEGRDEREPVSHKPTIAAAFSAESYRPGTVATLVAFDSAPRVSIRFYRVGAGRGRLVARDVMRGAPAGPARELGAVRRGQAIRVRLGSWPSGVYYAELTAPGGRLGYAPFVLAPAHLGEHRIAVVLPTQTWQAYNYRDDDGDGSPDTWYQGPPHTTARLYRPFENRGVPAHYRYYDEPFLRWLARNRVGADFISDAELNAFGGRRTRACIRPAHLPRAPRVRDDPRVRRGDTLPRRRGEPVVPLREQLLREDHDRARRDDPRGLVAAPGPARGRARRDPVLPQRPRRSIAARGSCERARPGAGSSAAPGSVSGDAFSSGGIEADRVDAASPRNLQVLAEIPNLFGDGRSAQMTYYRTKAGGLVFAAGAFSLACSIWQPPVSTDRREPDRRRDRGVTGTGRGRFLHGS